MKDLEFYSTREEKLPDDFYIHPKRKMSPEEVEKVVSFLEGLGLEEVGSSFRRVKKEMNQVPGYFTVNVKKMIFGGSGYRLESTENSVVEENISEARMQALSLEDVKKYSHVFLSSKFGM